MKCIAAAAVAAVFLSASSALAGVTAYTSGSSQIQNVTNFARFDTIVTFDPLFNYQEDGLRVSVDDFAFRDFSPVGFDNSGFYYPNGGVGEQIDITKVNTADFDSIDFQVSHGFGGSTIYVWLQVYLNGGFVAEFDFDVAGGTYIGVTGGGFDQLLVASYQDAATRNQHNPALLNAIALDYMRAGQIPAPAALALLGLAGCVARRRRA